MIYVNTEEEHNKFWRYEVISNTVQINYGRLGTAGQQHIKTFHHKYDADLFIDKKTHEKVCKGYRRISEDELAVLTKMASIIGTGTKIDDIYFAKMDNSSIVQIKPEEMTSPDVKPVVYARIVNRRKSSEDSIKPIEFLFDVDKAAIIQTCFKSGEKILTKQNDIKSGNNYEQLALSIGKVIGEILM